MLVMSTLVTAKPIQKRGLKSCYKKATLTQYWIPKEGDKDMTNDGKSVTLDGPKQSTLKTKNGQTIAKVSKVTYEVNKASSESSIYKYTDLFISCYRNFKWKVQGYLKMVLWSI